MADLKQLLDQFSQIATHPGDQLRHYLEQGKQVVGCFPSYTPEELVEAAGMVPMGLWGGPVEPFLAKKYLPAFACPILQSTLELGLSGAYQGLSAVLIPTLCDTFRCVSQDWRFGVPDIPMIPVTQPQNRVYEGSVDFLISEYEAVLAKLSTVTGLKMTDAALEHTIEVYNEHSALMREFAEVANDHLDLITPTVRHTVMKSAHFFEKGEHNEIMKDILAGLKALPKFDYTGKRIVLSGITAEPAELLDIFAENHMAVVGDDLGQETRQYRTDIPAKGGSPIRRLALQWNAREGCCLAHEDYKKRGELLVDLCKKTGATGVVYCQMKFCDPEEYDYPICARALRAEGIQVLQLEIDQQNASYEQARTRIQTFGEMI